MPALIILALILCGLCAWALVYWVVVWVRVSRVMRDRPTIRAGLDVTLEHSPSGEGWPKLSVIIPAHNEENVIDACCRSLREQDYAGELEIIFVLDRCTDRTVEIVSQHAAEDDRIIVIENETCPEDWAGKCNAARHGAERATGEYLIFTDADTLFDPALCRAAVALTVERDLALLSLLSTLTYRRSFEKIAQPVATLNLLRLFPPRNRSGTATGGLFANGQFMLFPRIWYDRIGGHVAVHNALLEDLAFARLIAKNDGMGNVLLADGMLSCAMYENLDEFRSGWKRIFIEASHRVPRDLHKYAYRIVLAGVIAPLVQVVAVIVGIALLYKGETLFAIPLLALVVGSLVTQFIALARVYTIGSAPIAAVCLYPAGCWIVASVLLEAANDLQHRRPVRWGGREYVLEPFVPGKSKA